MRANYYLIIFVKTEEEQKNVTKTKEEERIKRVIHFGFPSVPSAMISFKFTKEADIPGIIGFSY